MTSSDGDIVCLSAVDVASWQRWLILVNSQRREEVRLKRI